MQFIHPATEKAIAALVLTRPHAVLFTGQAGAGLLSVAKTYAAKDGSVVTVVLPEKDEVVDEVKGTITVASIRRLYESTKTKAPKGRTVIIDYAERMGIPAQNAFLKLLEEPPVATQFLLLAHQTGALLPTILSRVQTLTVRPITIEQTDALLDDLAVTNATKRTQLKFIATGLPAELTKLATDEVYFDDRVSVVKDARTLITGTSYDRLLLAKKYKDSRPQALQLLEDATKQMRQTLISGGGADGLRVLDRLELLHTRITEQGNVRLQLSASLML